MASLKSLGKDTMIYGVSSIVGRFLNYLLVPLYTVKMSAASGGYGVISRMYAYTALLFVLLTFGMETSFFRFANKDKENAARIFSTATMMVTIVAGIFVAVVLLFLQPIANALQYPDHPEYVWTMAITVALDVFQSIPFAYLRFKKRPIKFASFKILFIAMNITLNLIYYVGLNRSDVAAAFYINLFCTTSITFLFYKEIAVLRAGFSFDVMKKLLSYGWPLLILGVAGILNQCFDKMVFPDLYTKADSAEQLSVYSACSKVAMIMAMITQAFRYAYEPFVFGSAEEKNSKEGYAKAMKYFLIFTLLAFLMVVGYIDILRLIIGRDYWSGLRVVPIVMAAEIMMGVYFNLSFWYKLIDKTIWGAVFSCVGCGVLILFNIIFVPRFGYMACAWGGVAGYGTAMVFSYIVGQKKNRIDYPLRDIGFYVGFTLVFYVAMTITNDQLPVWAALIVNTLIIVMFAMLIVKRDFPLEKLPVIGKKLKKK